MATFNDDMQLRNAYMSKSFPSQGKLGTSYNDVDASSTTTPETSDYDKGAAGFARGAQGGLGTGVLSAGIASGSPVIGAAGVGLMALEADAQAKQAEEEAKAIEAQHRKQAQMTAINNLISVSKGLSLGA